MDKEIEDVRAFRQKFELENAPKLQLLSAETAEHRYKFLWEELEEFRSASLDGDLIGMLDALLDIVYVAKGTAVMMGIGHMWGDMWDEVQRSNMAKIKLVSVDDDERHRYHVSVKKPEGWKGPDLRAVIDR